MARNVYRAKAHQGAGSSLSDGRADFDEFCRRQVSRCAVSATEIWWRYLNRRRRLAILDEFEVIQRGQTAGWGGPSTGSHDE